MRASSALGTVLRPVHAHQLALQANVPDAVLFSDGLWRKVGCRRECPSELTVLPASALPEQARS